MTRDEAAARVVKLLELGAQPAPDGNEAAWNEGRSAARKAALLIKEHKLIVSTGAEIETAKAEAAVLVAEANRKIRESNKRILDAEEQIRRAIEVIRQVQEEEARNPARRSGFERDAGAYAPSRYRGDAASFLDMLNRADSQPRDTGIGPTPKCPSCDALCPTGRCHIHGYIRW